MSQNRKHWWQFWRSRATTLDDVMKEAQEYHKVIQDLSGVPNAFKGGRVTKVKSAPEYDPDRKVKGGQMVRTMPRQLRKIKNAQETKAE